MKTVVRLSIVVLLISVISILTVPIDTLDDIGPTNSLTGANQGLNTTVVILNWSRLFNVKKIISNICKKLFDDTVHSIIIWNNNPQLLFFEDFSNTSCSSSRLQVINSPENLYFQARYMACARAATPYCFIQDDDYFVRPEIIKSLAARMDHGNLSSIHLQPPDEMLSSQLRTIIVGRTVHATFAWLGYGTIVKRSHAIEFLSLLDSLDLADEEHKMADNYFTILSNMLPERWFDAGIPLGGGEPFTVGAEGDERNSRHITRAVELLDSISHMNISEKYRLPYISFAYSSVPVDSVSRAPCHGRLCVFETSIKLLPDLIHTTFSPNSSDIDMLELEKRRLGSLGEDIVDIYLLFPPSNAVDGISETAFRSPRSAKQDDWLALDLIRSTYHDVVRVALLVHETTEGILRQASLESSKEGLLWESCHEQQLTCTDASESEEPRLKTCTFTARNVHARYFRVHLFEDAIEYWIVYEMYLDQFQAQ